MYRHANGALEVLLAHPGGPYWRNKDQGAWTIPKGEVGPNEDELAAAQREFREETGLQPAGPFIDLGQIRQKSGKIVRAWAFRGNCDPRTIRSNLYEIEWPPRSGKRIACPEVDRAEFFAIDEARRKILPAQSGLLDALIQRVAALQ
jgi:predicted NUDIX family NTP pyrophosphohydrolase